jgi:O-antigen/teichoic acid export membrane protein
MDKITTDILFSFATRVAIRFRGLLFIPLISVYLGVPAFGAYTQVLAIVTLLSLITCLGLHESLVRYGERMNDLTDLYWSLVAVVFVSSSLLAVCFYIVAKPLAELTLGSSVYTNAFRLGALLIITRSMILLARNYFRIDSRIKLFSAVEAIKVYAIVGAVSATVIFAQGTLVDIFSLIAVIEVLFIFALHGKILREIGVTVPTLQGLRQHLAYSVPITASTIAGNASSRVDRIIIGYFLGASAVGIYSMAYQISVAILMYVRPIRNTFFPEFASLLDDNDLIECGRYVREGCRYFLMISIPTAGGMYLIGADVVSLLVNGQATPSPALFGLIALGMVANGVQRIYGTAMAAAEKTDTEAIIYIFGAIANVLLNLVAVPKFGIGGAAAVTLLTYVLVAGLTIWRVRTFLPTELPVESGTKYLGGTIVMVLAATAAGTNRIVLTVVLSVIVYGSVLMFTRELTVVELYNYMQS